jgi:hypothetical protein
MTRTPAIPFLAALICMLSACELADPGGNVAYDRSGADRDVADAGTDPGTPADPGAPDEGEPTDASGIETIGPPPNPDHPSAELVLAILYPSATGATSTAGSRISLAGIVFDRCDDCGLSVTWSSSGGASGVATGTPYWQTDAIDLVDGDNVITVTATREGETVSDRITITSNAGFMFTSGVQVRPPAQFEGEDRELLATLNMGIFGNMIGGVLTLGRVDADGKWVESLGLMKDDGQLPDEIQSDGVYSLKFKAACTAPEPVRVRAQAMIDDGAGGKREVLSPVLAIDCVQRLPQASCSSHKKLLTDARTAYLAARAKGGAGPARKAALAVLAADPEMAEAAVADETGSPWIRWKDGVLGAVNVADASDRGGDGGDGTDGDGSAEGTPLPPGALALIAKDAIESKSVLLLSPFAGDFGTDETTALAGIAADVECPAFTVKGPLQGTAANLDAFRSLHLYGIVVVATHGDASFATLSDAARARYGWRYGKAQEVLWTGESVDCGRLTTAADTASRVCKSSADCPAGTECVITQVSYSDPEGSRKGVCHDKTQVDLMAGRIVMGDRTYGVTPSFVLDATRGQRLPNSVVHLGACRTMYNGTLAASLLAGGASVVTGYTDVVSNVFARKTGTDFLTRLVKQQKAAGPAFLAGSEDPDHEWSFFRMLGSKTLTLGDSGILNASFESGDLTAWQSEGDGRVVTKLGGALPPDGKHMAIISTGLGFTTTIGRIEQKFCIPKGSPQVTFFWRFYSEEFKEYCGSKFQDTFQARLVDADGEEHDLVNVAVDDLCEKGEKACQTPKVCGDAGCETCGAQYVGLDEADVAFDRSGVWATPWQKKVYDLGDLSAGGPVTLRFYCTDKGDSIFDTAVLVDKVAFGEQ